MTASDPTVRTVSLPRVLLAWSVSALVWLASTWALNAAVARTLPIRVLDEPVLVLGVLAGCASVSSAVACGAALLIAGRSRLGRSMVGMAVPTLVVGTNLVLGVLGNSELHGLLVVQTSAFLSAVAVVILFAIAAALRGR